MIEGPRAVRRSVHSVSNSGAAAARRARCGAAARMIAESIAMLNSAQQL